MNSHKNKTRWEKMDEVSARIKMLRDNFIKAMPEITVDRARLVTESYQQTLGERSCVRRAKAFKNVLENTNIGINDGELIVGSLTGQLRGVPVFPEYDWEFVFNELDTFDSRIADRFHVSEDSKRQLRNILPQWQGLSLSNVARDQISEESHCAIKDTAFILTALRSGVGHIIVDYGQAVAKGLNAYIEQIEELVAGLNPASDDYGEKKDYYEASAITCKSVISFARRHAELAIAMAEEEANSARRVELIKIAEICKRVPAQPARNFAEALQSLWFLHIAIQLESNGHSISLGRFDQYLFPYYKVENDKAMAEELLHCLWLKFCEVNKIRDKIASVAFGGYPMFQHITLGGQTTKGTSAINELSYLCLDATAKVGLHQPSTSIRWFAGCDDDFFKHALKTVGYGSGMPAFFNDEVLISNMLQAGYSIEQAGDYSIVGCTETSVGGISEPWLTGGFINLLKIIELTIFDGLSPVTGKQFGMRTGEVNGFDTFEDFFTAYCRQIKYYLSLHVECDNILDNLHGQLLPNVFASTMITGCLERGKSSLQGGADFNSTTINAVGIANAADSLAVIKKFIYEEKALSWKELKKMLLNNFDGYEAWRQIFINNVPKYGNDEQYVDSLAERIHEFLYEEFKQYRNPRGGRYYNALYSIACHVLFADKVGATPDGRTKGMVLADGGVSSSQGRDINGPTAMLKSVVKLDPLKAIGSTLLNMKFHPDVFSSRENIDKVASLLKSYFLMKGQHIQLNVVDGETLRDAQKNPEKYASLVVRVAGFSVLFTTIDPLLQEDIILRTENCYAG